MHQRGQGGAPSIALTPAARLDGQCVDHRREAVRDHHDHEREHGQHRERCVRIPPVGQADRQQPVVGRGWDEDDDDGQVERREKKHRLDE
eukprot:scaffold30870_cov101-Isochrysis_galbana.AAC.1